VNYLSVIVFALTAIIIGLMVLRFNLRTYSLVRDIRRVAEREGTTWSFYGDPQRHLLFLFRPEKLIDPSDGIALRSSKETLLDHRKRLWPTLLITWGIMIAGFVLSTGVPLGYALLNQNRRAR
jgi:hypothetical protein